MSGKETPALEQPVLSRRQFLAGAGLAVGLGLLTGDSGPESYRPGTAYERNERAQSLKINLGVVAVAAAGQERYHGDERIAKDVTNQIKRIQQSVDDTYEFSVQHFSDDSQPDAVRQTENGEEPYYTDEKLHEIAEEYRSNLGECAIMMVVVDSADTENTNIAGLANRGGEFPRITVRAKVAGPNVYSHELGHVLTPNLPELGQGLNHQRLMNSRLESGGEITQFYTVDTIQALIESGCGLAKKDGSDDVNEYASLLSVMGDCWIQDENPESRRPLFSPPEIAFLNPRRKVELVKPKPAEFTLSYEPSELFGVEMSLPRDHALRQIIPEADTLFFGQAISGLPPGSEKLTLESKNIKKELAVFATWDGGRSTALLDLALFREEGDVIYADEQLNLVAVTGCDDGRGGQRLRFVALDSAEGQALLADSRERTRKRNSRLLETLSQTNPS